ARREDSPARSGNGGVAPGRHVGDREDAVRPRAAAKDLAAKHATAVLRHKQHGHATICADDDPGDRRGGDELHLEIHAADFLSRSNRDLRRLSCADDTGIVRRRVADGLGIVRRRSAEEPSAAPAAIRAAADTAGELLQAPPARLREAARVGADVVFARRKPENAVLPAIVRLTAAGSRELTFAAD